jgi:hypothetical protein
MGKLSMTKVKLKDRNTAEYVSNLGIFLNVL